MVKKNILIGTIAFTILGSSCYAQKSTKELTVKNSLTELKFTVTPAPEWSSLLTRSKGWLGGDGIYMLTLNGDERMGAAAKSNTMIWFSDTQLGEIVNHKLVSEDTMVINNSVAILKGIKPNPEAIQFYWNKAGENKPASMFKPATAKSQPGEYYWLSDAFVNHAKHNDIYLFGYRVKNVPGRPGFGFAVTGSTLIRIPAGISPQFARHTQIDIPFFNEAETDSLGTFGNALLVNTKQAGALKPDGYLYIYRVSRGEVSVSRVAPGQVDQFDAWRFWDGKQWGTSAFAAKPVAAQASNELSITALEDGRYLMVFQLDGVGTKVGARIGASPVGPFGPVMELYDAAHELSISKHAYVYNAKAHPVISKPGELLISYNINSTDYFNDIKRMPDFYRPRFIKLKYALNQ